MSDYLVKNYSLNQLEFSKLKKHSDYLVCKIKYAGEPFFIQFPKMKVSSINQKELQLEFLNNSTKYNKESYNFLSELDSYISEHIYEKSEEWFGKKIPLENIKNMYNKFIKAPKSTDNKSTMNFIVKKDSVYMDTRKNEIEYSEIKESENIECIAQMKYIMFSKDNCFTVWEVHSGKVHRTVDKVPAYGFLNVDSDSQEDSDEENISEIINFF